MGFSKVVKHGLPAKLDRRTREFVKQSFFYAADLIGEEEFNYISRKINQKLDEVFPMLVEVNDE